MAIDAGKASKEAIGMCAPAVASSLEKVPEFLSSLSGPSLGSPASGNFVFRK